MLIPGAKAPRLVTRSDLKDMKNGAVIVDVAIDQGGCIETARPTTHQQPTYVVDGVVHYCVTNMPGAVGRTSTIALCNATLPYALKIANKGYEKAAAEDPGFGEGINLVGGRVTNAARWPSRCTCSTSRCGRRARRNSPVHGRGQAEARAAPTSHRSTRDRRRTAIDGARLHAHLAPLRNPLPEYRARSERDATCTCTTGRIPPYPSDGHTRGQDAVRCCDT